MNGQYLGEAIRQIIVGAFTPAGAAGGAVLIAELLFRKGYFA